MGEQGRTGSLAQVLPSLNDAKRAMWAKSVFPPADQTLPDDERHTDGHWRLLGEYLTLYTDLGETGVTVAPVGEPRAYLQNALYVENGTAGYELTSEMSDVLVPPGQTRLAQDAVLLARPRHVALDGAMRWVAGTHKARLNKPPVFGWCSWYDCWQRVTQDDVIGVANAVRTNRQTLPMTVIQIDDGFQRQVGDWRCDPVKFPDGWPPVIEAIRDSGAQPGVWLAPLLMNEAVEGFDERNSWLQRDARGRRMPDSSNWAGEKYYIPGGKTYWIDPTHPDARAFITTVMQEGRDVGFTYFKIDFNRITGRLHDSSKTHFQALRDLYTLYRQIIGDDAYLLSCNGFQRAVVGLVDAARIGPDTNAQWDRFIGEAIPAVGATAEVNDLWFANDPDVTYARARWEINDDEWRTWHGFVGLLGGLQLVSEPLHKPPYRDDHRTLELLNPPAPEKGRGLHAGTDPQFSHFGILARRPWGDFGVVQVWNPSAKPHAPTLNTTGLGLADEPFHLWSFWDGTYLGIARSGRGLTVTDHEGLSDVRLTHDGGNVWTLHLTRGRQANSRQRITLRCDAGPVA